MNALFYRLVFNTTRGMLMVVSDISRCGRNGALPRRRRPAASRLNTCFHPLTFVLWTAAGLVSLSARADIVADSSAPRDRQPTVVSTANGLPQVNIQNPSAAGVSRNTYSRFDVDENGAVLNNSHKNVRSQLGGSVAANPWLGKQEARVILNEVNSRDPSQLRGFIEVAGKRAEVVIANPSGITCSGCGFINASRTTLTTGTAVMQNGQLQHFDVNGGRINIDGKGLDDTRSDYTQLIARSVTINAQVQAQQLNVVTGSNQVNVTGDVSAVKTSAENKPTFAMDVSALGGMYANKISLVGTEKGVGVHNAGALGAGAGELKLSAEGRLENSGTMQSHDALHIASTGGIDNSGQLRAGTQAVLTTAADITNRGSIVAHNDLTAQAGQIGNAQTGTLAAGVDEQGGVTRSASLTMTSTNGLDNSGQLLAGGQIALAAATGITNSGNVVARDDFTASSRQFSNRETGTLAAGVDERGNVTRPASLTLTSTDSMDNSGQLLAGGQIGLAAAARIDNRGNVVTRGDLTASTGQFVNHETGTLAAGTDESGIATQRGNLALNSRGDIDNRGQLLSGGETRLTTPVAVANRGRVMAHGDLTVNAGRIDSSSASTLAAGIDDRGTATQPGSLTLTSTHELAAHGQNLAAQRMTARGEHVDFSGSQTLADTIAIDATAGEVSTAGATVKSRRLAFTATDSIINDGGQLSAETLSLSAPTLSNKNGLLRQESNTALAINNSRFDNRGGAVIAAGDLELQTGTLHNQQGLMQSNGHSITLTADHIDNQQGSVQLSDKGQITVNTQYLDGAQGEILSAGVLNLTGITVNLDGATTQAQQITLNAQSLSHRGGVMQQQGGDAMTLTVADLLDNQQGRLESNGDMYLRSAALDNSGGRLLTAGAASQHITVAGAVNNSDGNILSARDIALIAATLQNQHGHLAATGGEVGLQITRQVDNQSGRIEARDTLLSESLDFNNDNGLLLAKNIMVNTHQQAFSNLNGNLNAQQTIQLSSGRFDNTHGNTQAGGELEIDTHQQALINVDTSQSQGGLLSGSAMRIQAGEINNRAGVIAAQGQTAIQGGALANNGGSIVADGDISLSSAALDNTGGTLQSAHRLAIDTHHQALNNAERGALIAKQGLTLHSGDLNNARGEIATQGDAVLDSGATDNRQGRITVAGALSLNGGDVNNQSGQIGANGSAALHSGSIDNRQGSLTSGETLTIASQQLDNSAGLIRANKDLNIDTHGQQTINRDSGAQGGIIASGNLLLRTGQLDNQRGFIAADGLADLSSGNLNNVHGQIAGNGGLRLNSGSIDNTSGNIQSGSDLALNTTAQALGNRAGKLIGAGATHINSGQVDNQGGHIQGGNDLVINTGATMLLNQHGKLLSAGDMTLSADSLNNQSGEVQVSGDGRMDMARQLDNRAGLIRGGKTLRISANDIVNRDTRQGQSGIEASLLTLIAQRIDNVNGALRATQRLVANLSRTLDNRNGLTSSGGVLEINDASGQQLAINNQGGTLIAGSAGSIRAASLSGDGQVLSQGSLNLTLNNSFHNTATLGSNGDLTLNTRGDVNNDGKITSGAGMTLQAQNINNSTAAEIVGQTINLIAGGTLTNTGLVDGGLTHLVADTLNNIGTGRIYGDRIAIQANTLNNLSQKGKAAVIAARDSLDIGAGNINNRDHALIYSAGNLHIGGVLDGNLQATGRGGQLNNAGATIEAGRDARIEMAQIDNTNRNLVTKVVMAEKGQHHEAALSGQVAHYDWSSVDTSKKNKYGVHSARMPDGSSGSTFYEYDFTRTVMETRVQQSDPGKILAGGNMHFNVERLLNRDSQIVAGGSLAIDSGELNNSATKGTRVITDVGKQTRWYAKKTKKRFGGTKTSQGKSSSNYRPAAVTQTIDLQTITWQANGNVQGSGQRTQSRQDKRVADTASGASGVSGIVFTTPLALGEMAVSQSTRRPLLLPSGQQFALTLPPAMVNGMMITPVIRMVTPSLQLPDNSLFNIKPESQSRYLVETDARYTRDKTWLGSDYMQAALSDTQSQTYKDSQSQVYKRLGDGFYEQSLVRDQVTQLTGNRYVDHYTSDEEQFRGLMNSGIAFGKTYRLQPGVALSPEQMALLTTDIVWLVNQVVTLPDGTQQTVQVPQVYARLKQGDLTGDGALMGGHDVAIASHGEVINSGTIQGREVTQVTAESLSNSGFISGNRVDLSARQNIVNAGGQIQGGDRVDLLAGHDITSHATLGGDSERWIDRPAGIYVQNAQGELRLRGLNNVTLNATDIANSGNAGTTVISAGNDLQLSTLTTRHLERGDWGKGNYRATEQQAGVGSTITTTGDLLLSAGRDISATAATVRSEGELRLQAGRDMTLAAGRATTDITENSRQSGRGWLSAASQQSHDEVHLRQAEGTTLSADRVHISAGRDVVIDGSNVVGTHDVTLAAARDLTVTAATESREEVHRYKESHSGLMGTGGIGITVGSSTSAYEQRDNGATTSQSGSTVGSTDGNLSLTAGGQAHISGSGLVAGRDLSLTGDSVIIDPGHDRLTRDEKFEQKSSGLTLALSGVIGNAVNSAVASTQSARKESDSRLAALQATKAALSGVQAMLAGAQSAMGQQPAPSNGDPNGGLGISASFSTQKSSSRQQQISDSVSGSTLNAGDHLAITATGQGGSAHSGDIIVAGSQLKAAGDTRLDAAQDILLSGAANTAETRGKSSSSGGGVGISLGVGQGSAGLSIFASVNGAKGKEQGNGTHWSETTLDSGGRVTLHSGRDTTLSGAQVSGNRVIADVGRDLTLSSQQDSDRYNSAQRNFGAGGSFTFGSMSVSGYASVNQDKLHSNFDSVEEQSGIYAGQGGFDIRVGQHTQLDGAVIASQGGADKNRLDTGTLGLSDIVNRADYSSSHSGGNMALSSGGSLLSGAAQTAKSVVMNTLLSGLNKNGHAEGTTQSAVSDGSLIIRDTVNQQQNVAALSRDPEHANDSLSAIFDKDKEQKRLESAQLAAEIGEQMTHIVTTVGDMRGLEKAERATGEEKPPADAPEGEQSAWLAHLRGSRAYQQESQNWGTGGTYQRVVQSVSGLLSGLVTGNIGQAAAGGVNPWAAQLIKRETTDESGHVDVAANAMAHAVWGAVAAQMSGGNAASGAVGAFSGEMATRYIASQYFGADTADKLAALNEHDRETLSLLGTLAAGLAGGMAGNSSAAAATGAQAGKNAVENNALSLPGGLMNYGQAAASWSQYAVDNNLTPEQAQEGLNRIAIGEGASWGTEYKVKPYVKGEVAGGAGAGYYFDTSVDPYQISANRGETLAVGGRISGQIGIQFGPYFPGTIDSERNSSIGLGLGVISSEISYGKDGFGFSFGVGPAWGWSGVSTNVAGGKVDINGSSGTELYHHDFRQDKAK